METPTAGRREWIGLAVLALPCILYAMDLTVLNLAVPHLTATLRPSSTQLLWVVDIYGFLMAGFLVTMGTLGDRIGRRRLLLIGAAAFGGASVLAAFSTSAAMLIATRAVLGVTAATLAPSTLSLIRNMFLDPRQRTLAIGVWITSFSTGGAIGPLIGGALLERFWWGSVFLIGVPIMLLLLLLGPVLLPEFRDPKAGRLDPISALLSLATVLAVIYGLKQLAANGIEVSSVLSIVAGLAIGLLFIRRQQSLRDPLLDLGLFRLPTFRAALTTNTLDFFLGFGVLLFVAQYLQLVLGLSPWQAGLWSIPSACGVIVGSMLTPIVARHVRPSVAMAGGLAITAGGFFLLTQLGGASALAVLVTGSTITSLGLAPVTTLATDIIVGAVPPEHAGAASAISETSSELGGALGIALLGSIATAVYRHDMALTSAIPGGVPAGTVEAARNTLGAAAEAAAHLPPVAGTALLETARAAFTHAFEVAAAVSAILALAAAVFAAVLLRDAPRGDLDDVGVDHGAPEAGT